MHKLQVFYDGSCPLCSKEIGFYRQCQGADHICWVDLSQSPTGDVAPGLSKEEALSRFHVKQRDGTLVSGGAAFVELWSALPRFRPLGQLVRMPASVWVLNRLYELFLKFRPLIKRIFVAR